MVVMAKSLITFPVVEKQICNNCKITLGIDKLSNNIFEVTQDAYGIPTIIVRCPVCKTLIEWEPKCN